MSKKEYKASWRSNKKSINQGDHFFVVSGKMAGTIATASAVIGDYVYGRHRVTNIEFRCLISDIEVRR